MRPFPFDSELVRLHPASIATMAESTLSFFILVYLLSLRGKTRDTWLMVGYVGLALIVYLIDIGVTSTKPPLYSYFRASHGLVVTVWTLFWTWCAYTYRSHPWRNEAIIVMALGGCFMAGTWAMVQFPGLNIDSYFSFQYVYYTSLGLQIWTSVVLFRRSVAASRHWEEASGMKRNHFLNPGGQPAQALQAFALLFGGWAILTLGALLFYSISNTAFAYHICQMLLLLGVLIVHVTHASEITTFHVKLVALPLTIVLALLGVIPFLLYGPAPPESAWGSPDADAQQKLLVFAWLIPGSAVFVLVAFTLFYRIGLLRPLSLLLEGVHRIEEGDLDTRVPVLGQDEIGTLAKSLNKMASSLKAAQEELEVRVVERTAELNHSLKTLKSTQAQLIQKEKMASLGELTAGIAHEIQNPLNFVTNFSEVSTELVEELKEEAQAGRTNDVLTLADDLTQNLQKITLHGQRASSIVKGMLEHSRSSSGERQPTDLNALTEEYLQLSYHGLRAKDKNFNAEFTTDLDPDLKPVKVVPQEVGRVLLNLFNNAFYAVSEKKKQQPEGFQPLVQVSTRQKSNEIEIRVRDNGTGIPDSVRQKIFQPFFTTKPTGEGTGLGLSLSYDIVTKGHAGTLEVESLPGEYTEFVITLPA